MNRFLLFPALLLLCATGLAATDGVYHSAPSYYLGVAPRILKSLADLPAPLAQQVEQHLLARLGAQFYHELHFAGGQAADFTEDRWQSKDSDGDCAYELNFELQRPAAGVISYLALLSLKRDGSILREIDLPAVARAPARAGIITLAKAREIARARGFEGQEITTEINYDPDRDILVWSFRKYADSGLQGLRYRVLEIAAHDITAIREYDSYAIP